MDDDAQERQLSIHMEPEQLAGVYANWATATFSDYEITLTFMRLEYEAEQGDVPGYVVSRVNMSPRFARELIDLLEEMWSRWASREGIRSLPETDHPESG